MPLLRAGEGYGRLPILLLLKRQHFIQTGAVTSRNETAPMHDNLLD
jgi:hypothetical protein